MENGIAFCLDADVSASGMRYATGDVGGTVKLVVPQHIRYYQNCVVPSGSTVGSTVVATR